MAKNEAKKDSNKKILIIGISLILVAIAVVGVILYNVLNKEPENTSGNVIVGKGNVDTIQKDLQDDVDSGMFNAELNTIWNFKDGKSASKDAYLSNAESNKLSVYCKVTLDDTGELVYTSPEMPVGTKVQDLTLDKKLSKGKYAATCTYYLLDNDKKEAGKAAFSIEINISN